jgi:hypothetical protein
MEKWNDITLTDVINDDEFKIAVGTWLDNFKTSKFKSEMIAFPPQPCIESEKLQLNLCVLAAAAHKLANDNDIDVPEWVFEPVYFMPFPVFANNTKNPEYQEFLKKDAPHEFASRNIFCSGNILKRV